MFQHFTVDLLIDYRSTSRPTKPRMSALQVCMDCSSTFTRFVLNARIRPRTRSGNDRSREKWTTKALVATANREKSASSAIAVMGFINLMKCLSLLRTSLNKPLHVDRAAVELRLSSSHDFRNFLLCLEVVGRIPLQNLSSSFNEPSRM